MMQLGGWSQLFSIVEKVYRDTIFEVLSMFELDRGLVSFNRQGGI